MGGFCAGVLYILLMQAGGEAACWLPHERGATELLYRGDSAAVFLFCKKAAA